jgi:hypothetical protein
MTEQEQLDELRRQMLSDKSLPLKEGATNLVLGEGNLDVKMGIAQNG